MIIVKTDGSLEALLCLNSPVPWTHHERETFDNLNLKTVPIWILAAQRAEIRPTIDDEEQTAGAVIKLWCNDNSHNSPPPRRIKVLSFKLNIECWWRS